METEINTTHKFDLSNRLFIITVLLVAGVVVASLGAMISQFDNLPKNAPQEITVSGTGQAFIKPDIALVTFGVTTQASKSQDAVNQNNTVMNAVIAGLKSLGVAAGDIQTTAYDLTPVYGNSKILAPEPNTGASGVVLPPIYVDGGQLITGYSLDQEISVKIRNFDNINSIVDKATAAGATNVGSLQFTVDDPLAAQAQARALAIAAAKEKLTSLISQTGLQVDKLINISDNSSPSPEPLYNGAVAMMAAPASVAPQIQTGQLEVDSDVTLTYLLK